jgi:hypothetical protein
MTSTTGTPATSIHSRALLVWLRISTWSARKYDKGITAEINARHNATSDAGRYNKLLLPGDAKAYKALVAIAGSIRTQHYSNTLAWSDEGWRLLPTANYATYTAWLRKQQNAFAIALDEFASDYPALRAQASRLLNGMYSDADYPDVQDLRSRFALAVSYQPVPAQGDVRVDLGADQIAIIESAIGEQTQRAVHDAMRDAWGRLHDVVSKIADRLSQPEAIFRDSLITNADDCCDVLQRLNVTDDPDLEAMRQRVKRELTRYSPETLRDVPSHRQQTADRAASILTAMQGILS